MSRLVGASLALFCFGAFCAAAALSGSQLETALGRALAGMLGGLAIGSFAGAVGERIVHGGLIDEVARREAAIADAKQDLGVAAARGTARRGPARGRQTAVRTR